MRKWGVGSGRVRVGGVFKLGVRGVVWETNPGLPSVQAVSGRGMVPEGKPKRGLELGWQNCGDRSWVPVGLA